MALQTLKPRLATIGTRLTAIKSTKYAVQATPREQGRAGVATRARLLRDNPLCCKCEAKGLVVLACEVDHIIPLHQGGPDTDANKQNLCIPCHAAKTKSDGSKSYAASRLPGIDELIHPANLLPSGIPLTIVCGPAGGGKSTYIATNKGQHDLVIDMDVIRADLGIGVDQWDSTTLIRSLKRRNNILLSLATSTSPQAWFIVSAALDRDRCWWINALKPTRMVVVLTDKQTCMSRVIATRTGDRQTRSIRAITRWWGQYTNQSGHEVIRSA